MQFFIPYHPFHLSVELGLGCRFRKSRLTSLTRLIFHITKFCKIEPSHTCMQHSPSQLHLLHLFSTGKAYPPPFQTNI